MIKKPSRQAARQKRHYRMRNRLSGTAGKPRLAVFRSDSHIYAQIIDDEAARTLVAASTMEKAVKEGLAKTCNVEAAKAVGASVAQKALAQGISAVVFDRGGHVYHGRVKALAEAAREAGLKF